MQKYYEEINKISLIEIHKAYVQKFSSTTWGTIILHLSIQILV